MIGHHKGGDALHEILALRSSQRHESRACYLLVLLTNIGVANEVPDDDRRADVAGALAQSLPTPNDAHQVKQGGPGDYVEELGVAIGEIADLLPDVRIG